MILNTAAQIANEDPRKPIEGHPFREASGKSQFGGLCLDYDEGLLLFYRDPAVRMKIQSQMAEVGQDAIHEAIVHHGDLLGAIIVSEAREGRNYFERFDARSAAREDSQL